MQRGIPSSASDLDVLRALLVAGNDTTTNLLGGAMVALLDNPDQLAEVESDRTLVPQMIEEALRYVSPARWTMLHTRVSPSPMPWAWACAIS